MKIETEKLRNNPICRTIWLFVEIYKKWGLTSFNLRPLKAQKSHVTFRCRITTKGGRLW